MYNKLRTLTLLLGVAVLSSCGDNDNNSDITPTVEYDYSTIIDDYVDLTIVPTYESMKDNSKDLLAKVEAYNSDRTSANFDAVADAWKATRAPWEKSESFLFGPAGDKNLDPLLDSWPVDETQLDNVLASDQELTPEFVSEGLGYVTRGFHTVEYLIFRDGDVRYDITERELEYLISAIEVLRNDCVLLWASWDGGSSEQDLIDELELEIDTPFADEFKEAGNAGSRYLSQKDAIIEMIEGVAAIADELGKVKIGAAYEGTVGTPTEVESRFSYNSLTDFKNNMNSIKNSYLGGFDESNRGVGLTEFVAEMDSDLDIEVKAKIDEAIDAIDAIPEAFVNNLKDSSVEAAIVKIDEVESLFSTSIKALVSE